MSERVRVAAGETGRLEWLDRIRGFGIFLVMVGHVYTVNHPALWLIQGMNVSLFFLVTGFLRGRRREWEMPFPLVFKRKTEGILKPYLFYSGVMMVWMVIRLTVFGFGSRGELLHCLLDIFCLEGISALWFLAILYLSELTVSAAERVLYGFGRPGRNWPNWLFPLLAFCLFLAALFGLLTLISGMPQKLPPLWRLARKAMKIAARTMAASAFLMLGTLCFRFFERRGEVPALAASLLALLAGTGMLWNGATDFHYLSFGSLPLYFGSAFLAFLAVLGAAPHLRKDRFFPWLGRNALFFMATHLIALDFIQTALAVWPAAAGFSLTVPLTGRFILMLAAETALARLRERGGKK